MKNNKYQILMMGPPGSGKGTQAKLLGELIKIPVFSIRDIIENELDLLNNKDAEEIKEKMNQGELISSEFVNKLARKKVETEGERGFIFDGYPRNLQNVEGAGMASFANVNKVVNLVLKEENIIKRICSLRRREDDKPIIIKKRLRYFYEYTYPVIEMYRKIGLVVDVDGSGSIGSVHKIIAKMFGK